MKTISVAASDAAKHDLGLGRRDGDGLLPLAAGMHDASSDAMARTRRAVRHLPIRIRVGLVHDRLLIVKVDAAVAGLRHVDNATLDGLHHPLGGECQASRAHAKCV